MRHNVGPNTILLTVIVIMYEKVVRSESNLNDSVREYSVKEETASHNKTNPIAKTLQRELHGRQASFVPSRYPFHHGHQEVADNALSSSTYSRGIAHHDVHADYVHDYEETPHVSHAPFVPEVHHFDPGHSYLPHHHEPYHDHHDHHEPHHEPHHGVHHELYHHPVGYGHHRHYDHGLKAVLLPVAGLAILGAAAALVSNPVLLQLGVISGRRRRDTDEVTGGPEGVLDTSVLWRHYEPTNEVVANNVVASDVVANGVMANGLVLPNGEPVANGLVLNNPNRDRSDFQRKVLIRNAPANVKRLFRHPDVRRVRGQRPDRHPDKELIPVPLIEA